jgi:hypothetical protein
MFSCPLCGRKFQENPYLALEDGQTALRCFICDFTFRTGMTYRELYDTLEPHTVPSHQHKKHHQNLAA